jgi:hypothetical protein
MCPCTITFHSKLRTQELITQTKLITAISVLVLHFSKNVTRTFRNNVHGEVSVITNVDSIACHSSDTTNQKSSSEA